MTLIMITFVNILYNFLSVERLLENYENACLFFLLIHEYINIRIMT